MKRFLVLLPLLTMLSACVSNVKPNPNILRVGISPNSPPLIYKTDGKIVGVEASFAKEVSEKLNRKLVFVEVPWPKQMEYLENDKTDIIMSGMTVTPTREYRVNFTKPYMLSGLTPLFRRSDYAASGLVQSIIRQQNSTIGTVKDTTGEIFAKDAYPKATVLVYKSKDDAVAALKSGRINMMIHDATQVWWIASNNEAELVAFPEIINTEPLAWAISKSNMELLEQVNAILDQMKNDGSGEKILKNWFPDTY
ncbi:transporter substrate-binding domain-containing protein [Kiritimatiellota bacterium B12222]|nr:transporter substrate-binding domain-containing protein [Kiritimatiellota bacterium B12222]